jgi:hypothetical protein
MTVRPAAVVARVRLFFDSYAALWVIFGLQSDGRARVIFFAAAGVGALDIARLVRASHSRTSRLAGVSNVEDKGPDAAAYIATYLLPFLAGPPADLTALLSLAIYFVVIFAVAVQSSLALVNPTLYLLGYRVSMATVRGSQVFLVHRGEKLREGDHQLTQLMGGAGYLVNI